MFCFVHLVTPADFINASSYVCVCVFEFSRLFLVPGVKAKKIITQARENVARMVGGKADDIIFTSGGTEVD